MRGNQDVAVFSVPDAVLGEVPGAAVVLRPGSDLDVAGIRQFAASRLAGYKVPKHVRVVPAIPKSPMGKLRRWELAETLGIGNLGHGDLGQSSSRPHYMTPRDTLEWQLAEIWENVLQQTPIGIDDDFLDLGGNSLLAARIFDAVEAQCAVTQPPSILFSAPTIRALAQLISAVSRWPTPISSCPSGPMALGRRWCFSMERSMARDASTASGSPGYSAATSPSSPWPLTAPMGVSYPRPSSGWPAVKSSVFDAFDREGPTSSGATRMAASSRWRWRTVCERWARRYLFSS